MSVENTDKFAPLDLFINEIMERVQDEEHPLDETKRKALIALIDSIKQYIGKNPDIMTSRPKLEGLLELIVSGFRHAGYNTSESIIQSFPVIVGKLEELIEGIHESVTTEDVDLSKDSNTPINITGQVPQDQQLEIKTVNNEVNNAQPFAPVQKDDNVKVKHSSANVKFQQLLKQYPQLEKIPHKDKEAVRRRIIKAVKRSKRTGEEVLEAYKAITNRYKSIKWGKLEELSQELTQELTQAIPSPAAQPSTEPVTPNKNIINAAAAIKYMNMMNLYNHLDPSVRPDNPEDVLNDEKYIKMLENNQDIIDMEQIDQVINKQPPDPAFNVTRLMIKLGGMEQMIKNMTINELVNLIPYSHDSTFKRAVAVALDDKLNNANVPIHRNITNDFETMGTIPEIYNTAIKYIHNVLGKQYQPLKNRKLAFSADFDKAKLNKPVNKYNAKIYFNKGQPEPTQYIPPEAPKRPKYPKIIIKEQKQTKK